MDFGGQSELAIQKLQSSQGPLIVQGPDSRMQSIHASVVN